VVVLAGCDTLNLLIFICVCKGLAWILLATIAEVPPTVSLSILFGHSLFRSSLFHDIGVHVFKFEW
jgi:hypothetical protein